MKLSSYYNELLVENKRKIRDIISSKFKMIKSDSEINAMTDQLYNYFTSFTNDDDLIGLFGFFYFNNKNQLTGQQLKELANKYEQIKKYNLSLPKKIYKYKQDSNDNGDYSDELMDDINKELEIKKNELYDKNQNIIKRFPVITLDFLTLDTLSLIDKLSLKIKILDKEFDYSKYENIETENDFYNLLQNDLKEKNEIK